MFRAFQVEIDLKTGEGSIDVGPSITSMEWDIYQISVRTSVFSPFTQCEILHNGFFLCASPQGALDTATGPPDIVVKPGDDLTVLWVAGAAPTPPQTTNLATVGIWYNENPVGTTVSLTH